jgi:hypothetical protein
MQQKYVHLCVYVFLCDYVLVSPNSLASWDHTRIENPYKVGRIWSWDDVLVGSGCLDCLRYVSGFGGMLWWGGD